MAAAYRYGVVFVDESEHKSKRKSRTIPTGYDNEVVFIDENKRRLSRNHARTSLSKVRSHVIKFRTSYPPRRSKYQSPSGISRSDDNTEYQENDLVHLPLVIPQCGRWDPFDSFAVQQPSLAERRVIQWGELLSLTRDILTSAAINVLWPTLGRSRLIGDVFVKKYMAVTLYSALMWHTQIMTSAIQIQAHMKNLDERRKLGLMATYHRVASLRLLQVEIHKCESGPVGDDVISSILTMAIHANLPAECSGCGETPLAPLTNRHPYVRFGFGIEHMSALYTLVKRMGGLNAVDKEISRDLLQR
jgi:hypothetical protein